MSSVPMVEIVEIDRRQFLRIAGGALIAISSLGLVGCGGGGGGGAQGTTTVRGTVQVPTGFSTSVGQLTTTNVYSTNNVSKSLTFSQGVVGANPSLAYVQDSKGRAIFCGFLDPKASSNALGPTSTAIALLFFALDGYALPATAIQPILALISADSATAAFANVIQQRVAVNPYALDGADSQITAALLVAFNSIKGSTTKTALSQVAQPFDQPSQLLITGQNPQSGFSVNQDATAVAFIGQNSFRRYCKVYVYEIATVDKSGNKTTLPLASRIGTPIDVNSTLRLNLISSLQAIFSSTSPFAPVSTASIPLPLVANTSQTLYEIVVLGSSANGAEPAFFSSPAYANEVATWRSDISSLNLRSCFADVLFGLLLNFLGVTSVAALPTGTIDQAIADLTTGVQSLSFKQAVAQAAQAANPELIIGTSGKIVLDSTGASVAVADRVFIYGVANFLATAGGQQAVNSARTGVLINLGFRVLLGAISAATIVLGVGDLAAVVHDLAASDKADLWDAAVIASTLTLTPISPSVAPGGTVNFTVKLPSAYVPPPNTSVIYDWSQTGGVLSILSDNKGISGQSSIETTSTTVSLIVTPSQQAAVTVTVAAYSLRASGVKTLIDTVSTTATVTAVTGPGTITPGIQISEVITSAGIHAVAAFATFKPVAGANEYTWMATLAGNTVYGTTFAALISNGSLPVLDLTQNLDPQISAAPGGTFQIAGGLIAFFGGYLTYARYAGDITDAQAVAAVTSTFATPNPIKVLY